MVGTRARTTSPYLERESGRALLPSNIHDLPEDQAIGRGHGLGHDHCHGQDGLHLGILWNRRGQPLNWPKAVLMLNSLRVSDSESFRQREGTCTFKWEAT